jgi:AraC-like DNA-binding protein
MTYRELPPDRARELRLQCAWNRGSASSHRVYPNGSMDILYIRCGTHSRLEVAGAMTKFTDHPVEPGALMLRLRFRPGMLHGILGPPCSEFTGDIVDLGCVPGFAARRMKQMLDDGITASKLVECLPVDDALTPLQRAIACIEEHHGMPDWGWIARQANLSERQWRRACKTMTGLAPKQLCRSLRLQHALRMLRQSRRGALARVARKCGYYDQAHFIQDVREWPLELIEGAPIDS